jgi:predicted RNase H-like HicB family nuclease
MHKYETIIYWSNDDQVFVAEVPELPGCSAHGSTPEAALAQAHEAVHLWIDTAREFGDPVPEPKGERLMLALAATCLPAFESEGFGMYSPVSRSGVSRVASPWGVGLSGTRPVRRQRRVSAYRWRQTAGRLRAGRG